MGGGQGGGRGQHFRKVHDVVWSFLILVENWSSLRLYQAFSEGLISFGVSYSSSSVKELLLLMLVRFFMLSNWTQYSGLLAASKSLPIC